MNEDDRIGGRIAIAFGFGVALLLVLGALLESGEGPLSVTVWSTAAGFIALGIIVGISIGSYNLGRRRGR